MKIKRVMIAASKSGSGKTMVTLAFLWALKKKELQQVISYKCGPDYIDPMFHKKILDIPSRNLDTFFTGEEKTKELFLNHIKEMEFAVLEGVMGLYDGLGNIKEEGSSYHLAKVTKTPILFLVDAKGMGYSIIPLLAGFLQYDREHLIKGIILNRVSEGYYHIIKPVIEKELNILVIGFLPEKEIFYMESRYLGLCLPNEIKNLKEKVQTISELFLQNISMKNIMEIAENAEELKINKINHCHSIEFKKTNSFPTIAIARDEAFCFYYADNIDMLEQYGAKIIYFSPLWDKELPDCHALLFFGGYPELYAKQLYKNKEMRKQIKNAIKNGMPVVAECGGFMYLHSAIRDKTGISYPMVGVLPDTCFYTGKLVRFGYIELKEKQTYFLNHEMIKGHEFHYYDSTNNGMDIIARKPTTKREYSCIIENETQWMGFPHLYYPSNPIFVKSLIEKAEKYKNF